ncbi:sensor histidine kinase [Lederbergia sp. NSJ-179]|uniref:sensor histidine kinase n=1 Tax=Lederbergia sp. NSJ-179 TaxID=2931402 RepID=UPI001FD3E11E|nr:sensor histidine kinase [Lederbergia sp. NSJ-179]MCJ7840160.1 sensor histidine kinase [Lederbergia sp. NSJ-179]
MKMNGLSIKKKLTDMKLQNKLFLSFVLVVFVPVMIVGAFLTNELRQFALDDAVKQETENIERVKKRTIEVLKVPLYLSNNLFFDQRLQQIVNTKFETTYDVFAAYREYNTLNNYRSTYSQEIQTIRFYMDNPTLLNNWQIIPATSQVMNTSWYKNAANGRRLARWVYMEDETNQQQKYISLVRKINFMDSNTYGVLVISVNTDTLNLILSQESSPMILIDDQNHVIASNRPEYTTTQLKKIMDLHSTTGKKDGTYHGLVDGDDSYIFMDEIAVEDSVNQLRVVSIISNQAIVENAKRFGKMGLLVVTISVCIALCLIYYFSKFLSNRLLKLSEQINEVGRGNFDTPILIEGEDEIGQLSKQLQIMAMNTKQLLHEVEESNKQKRLLERKQNKIKFKMMASQINPHFLFNALESIRMRANLNGQRDIGRIVQLLGRLMRNSIEVGTGKVRLSHEIEIVKCYLEIQKFRYEERVHYELAVDPGTMEQQIPPLIIQPLVENAIIHGIENIESGGQVHVKTERTTAGILVEVIDNGVGISEKKMDEIKTMLDEREEKEGIRIGLRNVHQRLLLTYEGNSGLIIHSEQGMGTKISFLIPIGGV